MHFLLSPPSDPTYSYVSRSRRTHTAVQCTSVFTISHPILALSLSLIVAVPATINQTASVRLSFGKTHHLPNDLSSSPVGEY